MTGFGKAEFEVNNKKITIEIKSLNSKQIDINTRIPAFIVKRIFRFGRSCRMFWFAEKLILIFTWKIWVKIPIQKSMNPF